MNDHKLLDAELAVLGLIDEASPLSGYRVLTLVAERGMAEWSGLSPSTVYNNLRKLRRSGLVSAIPDLQKRGKGHAGFLYSASAEGRTVLRRHIGESLVYAKEHSAAFKWALAFCSCFTSKRITTLLDKREVVLQARLTEVCEAWRLLRVDGNEPRSAALLFEYVQHGLQSETGMTKHLAQILIAGDKQ